MKPRRISAPDHLDYMLSVGAHFVALTGRWNAPGEAGPGTYVAYSGFVVSVGSLWFLVTAGHALQEIEDSKAKGITFWNWGLDDTFALREKRPVNVDGPGAIEVVPFAFEAALKAKYFDKADGTDYAFIYLETYYERLLRQNGVTPFYEENWILDVTREADKVALIGIPGDQIRDEKSSGLVTKTLVSLSLTRVAEDVKAEPHQEYMLLATSADPAQSNLENFRHVEGMSGGPIIGFWRQPNGTDVTKILAVQSRWDKHSKTIHAYPAMLVAEHLNHLAETAYEVWLAQQGEAPLGEN